jgi:hypothetical protein
MVVLGPQSKRLWLWCWDEEEEERTFRQSRHKEAIILWPLAALPLPELELAQGLGQPEALTQWPTCSGGGGESDARKAGLACE